MDTYRRRLSRSFLFTLTSLIGVTALAGLAKEPRADQRPSNPAPATQPSSELPWEVIADNGDMVLPNLYYSEDSENEQIMSVRLGGREQIDHLIYPTIGNPKIFLRDNASDSVMLVMRLEASKFLSPFSPTLGKAISGHNAYQLNLKSIDADNGLFFYLVPRALRDTMGDVTASAQSIRGVNGVIAITPSLLGIQARAGVPKEFLNRDTVRAYFRADALKSVPQGLYDVRMELRRKGQLASTQTGYSGFDTSYNAVQIYDQGPKEGETFTALNFSDTQINMGWMFQQTAVPHLKELVQYLISPTAAPQVAQAKYITFNGDLHDGGAVLQRYPRGVSTEYQNESANIMSELKQLRKPVYLTSGNHDGYASTGHVPAAIDAMTRDEALKHDAEKLDEGKIGRALQKKDPAIKLDPRGLDPIEVVVGEQIPETTWPNLSVEAFQAYIADTASKHEDGGRHLDIFEGSHIRTVGNDFSSWGKLNDAGSRAVDPSTRNMVLYDGHDQWRKTYGPLYYSYSFGKNYYLSLNSFELRQHWRTGWGMYTVNYGGGMSDVQMNWVERELKREASRDVTIFAHHDPRGGHNGKDYPYYFGYVDYDTAVASPGAAASDILRPDYFTKSSSLKTDLKEWFDAKETAFFNKALSDASKVWGSGMMYSFFNFALSENLEHALCKGYKGGDEDVSELGCMHDGLQEWMTRDKEYDCAAAFKGPNTADGKCVEHHSWYSGYALLNLIARSPNVRTMVLGHTHFNSIDEFQAGGTDGGALIPGYVTLGVDTLKQIENAGPMRQGLVSELDVRDKAKLDVDKILQADGYTRELQGQNRELVIIRVTTAADLTSQYVGTGQGISKGDRLEGLLAGDFKEAFGRNKDKSDSMFGFQALTFSPSTNLATGETLAKLNRIDFYRNLKDGKAGYGRVAGLNIDRTIEMRSANGTGTAGEAAMVAQNPLHYLFRLGKKVTKDSRTDDEVVEGGVPMSNNADRAPEFKSDEKIPHTFGTKF